jgi:hypothetical protein
VKYPEGLGYAAAPVPAERAPDAASTAAQVVNERADNGARADQDDEHIAASVTDPTIDSGG